MQRPVNDQHRSGLAGVVAIRLARREIQCFEDVCAILAYAENPVRQQPEVPVACAGQKAHLFLPVLDIVADRAAVGMVHAGVHGKAQGFAIAQAVFDILEGAIGLPRPVTQEQAQLFLCGGNLAEGIAIAFVGKIPTLDRCRFRGHQGYEKGGPTDHSSGSMS